MLKRTIPLTTWKAKQFVIDLILTLGDGYEIVIQEIKRTGEQNKKLHAVLKDISEQVEWKGLELNVVQWKRLATYAWLRELGESPMMVPALDGNGMDLIYEKTSQMSKKQLTSLTEWCLAFGAENEVQFTEYKWRHKD
jgi:hypothetical protein